MSENPFFTNRTNDSLHAVAVHGASYHNHTTWSDGKANVLTMLRAAEKLRLTEVGIADHLVLSKPRQRTPSWSMAASDAEAYAHAVREAGEKVRPSVRLGVEADLVAGRISGLRQILDKIEPDYCIGAIHFVNGFPVDGSAERWQRLSQEEIDQVVRGYWERISELVHCDLFDIVAHLDLPKKFGFQPTNQPTDLIDAALDSIAEAELAVEVNTAGLNKPCAEIYPHADLLRKCALRNIGVVVSDDAHQTGHLLQHRSEAEQLLRECGYTRATLHPHVGLPMLQPDY